MAKSKRRTRWEFDHVCPYCRVHYDAINGDDVPGLAVLKPGFPAAPVVAALRTEVFVFDQVCNVCRKESGGRYGVRIEALKRTRLVIEEDEPVVETRYILSRAKTEKRY